MVIDRPRAADLGVRVGDIAQALNTLVAGQKVSTFNVGTDQYNVRVRAIGEYRASVEGLKRRQSIAFLNLFCSHWKTNSS